MLHGKRRSNGIVDLFNAPASIVMRMDKRAGMVDDGHPNTRDTRNPSRLERHVSTPVECYRAQPGLKQIACVTHLCYPGVSWLMTAIVHGLCSEG